MRQKRIAVAAIGSGTRAFVEPLLAFNAALRSNSTLVSLGGELALLERDVATLKAPLPVDKWLQDLDRIE